jgi:hypothetical protein
MCPKTHNKIAYKKKMNCYVNPEILGSNLLKGVNVSKNIIQFSNNNFIMLYNDK